MGTITVGELTKRLSEYPADRAVYAEDDGEKLRELKCRGIWTRRHGKECPVLELGEPAWKVEAPTPRTEFDTLMIKWLHDRAAQYRNDVCCRVVFDDLMGDVTEGRHWAALERGELEDIKLHPNTIAQIAGRE